jgi:hypothetical protein
LKLPVALIWIGGGAAALSTYWTLAFLSSRPDRKLDLIEQPGT